LEFANYSQGFPQIEAQKFSEFLCFLCASSVKVVSEIAALKRAAQCDKFTARGRGRTGHTFHEDQDEPIKGQLSFR
jgi:hypothetical protein